MDVDADDLLREAARNDRKHERKEVDRAAEFLQGYLKDGPRGSIEAARAGDEFLGHPWSELLMGKSKDERRILALGRTKWWREYVLKPRLEGEAHRAGFNGPYMFQLPDHVDRRLWPPPTEAIQAAHDASEKVKELMDKDDFYVEEVDDPPDKPRGSRGSRGSKLIAPASTVASTTEPPDQYKHAGSARAETASTDSTASTSVPVAARPVEAGVEAVRNKADTTASTASTGSPPGRAIVADGARKAETASTDSTASTASCSQGDWEEQEI